MHHIGHDAYRITLNYNELIVCLDPPPVKLMLVSRSKYSLIQPTLRRRLQHDRSGHLYSTE